MSRRRMPEVVADERHGARVSMHEVAPKNRRRQAVLRCDCGRQDVVDLGQWRRGLANQCPDCRHAIAKAARTDLHGMSYSPEYQTWTAMKRRCYDKKFDKYPSYGGDGIRVHAPWRQSFQNFLADVGTKPSPAHTLDRIDPFGHYKPGNVRWATPKEQRANQKDKFVAQH